MRIWSWLLVAVCSIHGACSSFQLSSNGRAGAVDTVFRLISEEPPRELLSAGAAVRLAAVLDDAGLNDVAAVGRYCWAVGERGVVCDSGDGGETWRTRALPFDCRLTSVCFLTNRRGWIAGIRSGADGSGRGVLLATEDGGESWQVPGAAELPLPGILQLQFFGSDEAIAVTLPAAEHQGATLFRTVDGGVVWEPLRSDRADAVWLAAGFNGVDEGVLGGFRQGLGVLTSSESVVLQQARRGLRSLRAVSLGVDKSGWAAGDGGTILRTMDSGVSWSAPTGDLPEGVAELCDIRTICHRGPIVVAGGDPGPLLLYSENAGSSWESVILPMAGRISRIRRSGAEGFLAVGSFGQILRTEDGLKWRCVRGAGRHAALMSTGVGETEAQSWLMLAGLAADSGLRSVVWHSAVAESAEENGSPVQEQEWLGPAAVTATGGVDFGADWQFPIEGRVAGVDEDRLLEAWNRQTDGRAEELLLLRLARQFRSYRPIVVVLESAGEQDSVAGLLERLIPEAVALAADGENQRLQWLVPEPWQVQRVLIRRPAGRVSSLVFSAGDLLRSEGTVAGLLQQAAADVRSAVGRGGGLAAGGDGEAVYEVLLDVGGREVVKTAFEGLGSMLTAAVRRQRAALDRAALQQAAATVRQWRLESGVLAGAAGAADSAETFVAGLEQSGAELPAALARMQLTSAAKASLKQGNLEGWLAIQQELIRRFRGTPEAEKAAELLVLAYGSAEVQLLRRSERRQDAVSAGSAPDAAGGAQVQPVIQPAAASGFGGQRSSQASALRELWDANEQTAWMLLTESAGADSAWKTLPAAVLRHAVTLRRQQQFGAATSLLAGLSGRADQWGMWARSEQQLTQGLKSDLFRQLVLAESNSAPVLDGNLADAVWEEAEEVRLVSDDDSQSAADSLALMAWDAEYIYVAARIARISNQPRPELAENRYYDESHANRDCFEICFDTDRDRSTAFRFCIDESGRTSESCWSLQSWNPRWHVAVDSEEQFWRVEAAIPARELAVEGNRPGALWAVQFQRVLPGVLNQRTESVAAGAEERALLVRFARN